MKQRRKERDRKRWEEVRAVPHAACAAALRETKVPLRSEARWRTRGVADGVWETVKKVRCRVSENTKGGVFNSTVPQCHTQGAAAGSVRLQDGHRRVARSRLRPIKAGARGHRPCGPRRSSRRVDQQHVALLLHCAAEAVVSAVGKSEREERERRDFRTSNSRVSPLPLSVAFVALAADDDRARDVDGAIE